MIGAVLRHLWAATRATIVLALEFLEWLVTRLLYLLRPPRVGLPTQRDDSRWQDAPRSAAGDVRPPMPPQSVASQPTPPPARPVDAGYLTDEGHEIIPPPPRGAARAERASPGNAPRPGQGSQPASSSAKANSSPTLGTKAFRDFSDRLARQPKPATAAPFVRDLEYEASPGVREALEAIDVGTQVVMVVGRAGTGKTRLIHYLRGRPGHDRQAVVAPTGVAALNASAQTIHSLFMLPHHVLDADDLPDGPTPGQLLRRMSRLVIDEVSMVRADLLDAIDARLRQARASSEPFGGVQVVMVGDFLQMPPVVKDEDLPLFHGLGYHAPYAFNAKVLQRVQAKAISLEKVYRQDDALFIDLLSRIREGTDLEQTVAKLNTRCVGPHRAGMVPLLLTPTRGGAERYNQSGMASLSGEANVFRAQIVGELRVDKDQMPVPEELALKVGARVIAAKNDTAERRWVNGSIGTVTQIEPDKVRVRFDHSNEEHDLGIAGWDKVRQQWNDQAGRIDNRVLGSYRQIPLNHAWAMTIHKAQGLTLDDVRVDLASGAFAAGQTYVALSRARSLAGLSLARPLRVSDVLVHPMLMDFTRWLEEHDGDDPA